LPKFCLRFNGQGRCYECESLPAIAPKRDLHQKNASQSPNGLKKPQDFHIRMLLLMAVTG
jgi:hypothetical protein